MCLLVLAWQVHPRYRLIVAANRDEFHERPTEPMAKWQEPPIIAGRDLRAGGTWLGVDRQRRFGIVTNFRELQRPAQGAPSRGNLIPDYLRNPAPITQYIQNLEAVAEQYSGFNLLLTDQDSLWYVSNRAPQFAQSLPPGIYGLSNELLDTPWPKLQRVRRQFDPLITQPGPVSEEALFAILADPTQAGVDEGLGRPQTLPETGLSPEWEQLLSSPFVSNREYGTRCSTLVMIDKAGGLSLNERRFGPLGSALGDTRFDLGPNEWPMQAAQPTQAAQPLQTARPG
jgi:uncharacterized protein with NRDE domain